MRVTLSLDLDLPEFNQSCFRISMFRWLGSKASDSAGNVIETHEHKGEFQRVVNGLAILQPFNGHLPYEFKGNETHQLTSYCRSNRFSGRGIQPG